MPAFRRRHVPDNSLHFWTALCLASILGCNTGDCFASFLGLPSGLAALVPVLAIAAFFERRNNGNSQAWYWLAIIIACTAATNLADAAVQQAGMLKALAGLAALLIAVRLLARARRCASASGGPPSVDGTYWLTLLIAGTLGTALGDFSSFKSGLGLGGASLALAVLVMALVAVRTERSDAISLSYWLVVVAIRTAGGSVGDYFTHQIGLWQSTMVFAILLPALLCMRPGQDATVSGA
ncbi:MAG: hypothetical protein M3N82_01555 [Pseudomonadota bacterium]|nr:hypothetical protein [Pseudomonadota bacterium]